MKLVVKFGGASLDGSSGITHVATIIQDHVQKGEGIVVVVSAMKGVTDMLIAAAEKAEMRNQSSIMTFLQQLQETHAQVCREAINSRDLASQTVEFLKQQVADLQKALVAIGYLGELTPRSRDHIISFGERLSAIIMSGALKDLGVKVETFLGAECGIVTDDHFGQAEPLMEITRYEARRKLEPALRAGAVAVVTGFVGSTQDGFTTTLGRGGSDCTAAILGVALEVDEVWVWKDTDGLMTADPKLEPLAKMIPLISFSEAMEMAYFGAKAVQARAVEIASEKGIPIRVKSTFEPDSPGTLIVKEEEIKSDGVVKAVTLIPDVALVTVSGAGMVGVPNVAAKVFSVVGENDANVLMISQGSSAANLSFVVLRRHLEKIVNALELSLLGTRLVRDISSETNVCVIAVVGAGMKGTPGVAARVFQAVANQCVNIRMIAQGSSELNISFVAEESGSVKALQAVHREFGLDR